MPEEARLTDLSREVDQLGIRTGALERDVSAMRERQQMHGDTLDEVRRRSHQHTEALITITDSAQTRTDAAMAVSRRIDQLEKSIEEIKAGIAWMTKILLWVVPIIAILMGVMDPETFRGWLNHANGAPVLHQDAQHEQNDQHQEYPGDGYAP